jgi:lysophospholipase L1-like esterase
MKQSSRPAMLAGILIVVLGLLAAATGSASAAPTDRPAPAPITSYVALGDSYTAAPLVPSLRVAGGCFRSTNNYPSVVARSLPGATFVDRSCSGAQTKDMTTSQLPGVPPQLSSLTPDTDLVTIGIGGNDFSVFGTLVGFCPTLRASDPTGAPCRDFMRDGGRDNLLADVALTSDRVETVVRQVHELAPNARVVVVGYPEIAPRVGTCPALLPLADGDYQYANQVNERLDQALRHAAAVTRSTYVDVWRASQGHDICSSDPWINGQFTDPTRAQSFHPFANEEAAVGALVLDAIG